jgi:hypothetical protein
MKMRHRAPIGTAEQMKGSFTLLLLGVLIAAISWAPIWISVAATQNVHTAVSSILIYVALAGSIFGAAISSIGLVALVACALRSSSPTE